MSRILVLQGATSEIDLIITADMALGPIPGVNPPWQCLIRSDSGLAATEMIMIQIFHRSGEVFAAFIVSHLPRNGREMTIDLVQDDPTSRQSDARTWSPRLNR